jgi:large repetitive protein
MSALILSFSTYGQLPGLCGPEDCGGQSSSGCWCDDACLEFNDCCSNFVSFCGVPQIDNVFPASSPTPGGQLLTITGTRLSGMDSHLAPIEIDIDDRPCAVQAIGAAQVTCVSPTGQGADLTVTATRAFNDNSEDPMTHSWQPFSYEPPLLGSLMPQVLATAGGTSLTITGGNFGQAQQSVTVGGETCSVDEASHGSIICTAPPGTGFGVPVRVTVAGQASNEALIRYQAPVIESVFPATLPTAGGETVTVIGSGFGTQSAAVQVGEQSCPVQGAVADNQITCLGPPGQGVGLPLVVTVDGQSSNTVSIDFSPPFIDQLMADTLPTAGGVTLTVQGQNFGTSQASVSVGQSDCPLEQHDSHTSLRCTLPAGAGVDRPVQLNVSGQASNEFLLSYDRPQIDTIQPSTLATSGGQHVTIIGSGFGEGIAQVSVGDQDCPQDAANNHGQIVCTAPQGQGLNVPVLVTVAGQLSDPGAVSYLAPLISAIEFETLPTAGGSRLTIHGSNFGVEGAQVAVGEGDCPLVAPQTHSRIECTAPAGQGIDVPVAVSVTGQVSNDYPVSYDPPQLAGLGAASWPTAGGVTLTVQGQNFGTSQASVSVGQSDCPLEQHDSHTSLRCTLPAGAGVNRPVQLNVSGQVSNELLLSYDRPQIDTMQPVTLMTSGGQHITIIGSGFGDGIAQVSVGEQDCPQVEPNNHGQIVCAAREGQGLDIPVQVTVAGQVSDPGSIDFHAPQIESLIPANGPSGGGITLTIRGTNFGLSGAVHVDDQVCVQNGETLWSHGQVSCLLPAGHPGFVPVVVTAAGQASNTGQFTYEPIGPELVVIKSGLGRGSVSSQPTGLSCPVECESAQTWFKDDTVVVLEAEPAPGSRLAGWGGACAETQRSECELMMDEDKSIIVIFEIDPEVFIDRFEPSP